MLNISKVHKYTEEGMNMKLVFGFVTAFMALSLAVVCHATPVLWEANGHYYEALAFPSGITWDDANALASSSTYMGMSGHLATITSMEEHTFIINSLGGWPALHGYFLGGFQPAGSPEPGGNWQWVTGETWSFSNWYWTAPNNEYSGAAIIDPPGFTGTPPWGPEDVLHIWINGQWNDVPHDSGWGGLIVEYEANAAPVPEPATMLLLGTGLFGLAGFRKKIKK